MRWSPVSEVPRGVPAGYRVTWDRIVPGLEAVPATVLPLTDVTYDLGSASKRWAGVYAQAFVGTYIALGTSPAQTGPVRLANDAYIYARNQANLADIQLIGVTAGNAGSLPTAMLCNDLYPDGDVTRVLGSPSQRWAAAYLFSILGGVQSVTASTTQAQGQTPLSRLINYVSVCANANDVVTLPSAVAGLFCEIKNGGAQTLQIFPASGDAINGGVVDTSVTLAAGEAMILRAIDATNWHTFGVA